MARERVWCTFGGVDVGHPSKAKHGQQLLTFALSSLSPSKPEILAASREPAPASPSGNSWRGDLDMQQRIA